MGKNPTSALRASLAVIFCWFAVLLAIFSFTSFKEEPSQKGPPRLAAFKLNLERRATIIDLAKDPASGRLSTVPAAPASIFTPTFGHPIISGIGGTGFEQSIRIDPTNPDRIYNSAPGSLSADTSWVWHSD